MKHSSSAGALAGRALYSFLVKSSEHGSVRSCVYGHGTLSGMGFSSISKFLLWNASVLQVLIVSVISSFVQSCPSFFRASITHSTRFKCVHSHFLLYTRLLILAQTVWKVSFSVLYAVSYSLHHVLNFPP